MPESVRPTWVCAACGHEWMQAESEATPTHCASSKCRSRKWNRGANPAERMAALLMATLRRKMGATAFAAMIEACGQEHAIAPSVGAVIAADDAPEVAERSIDYDV